MLHSMGALLDTRFLRDAMGDAGPHVPARRSIDRIGQFAGLLAWARQVLQRHHRT